MPGKIISTQFVINDLLLEGRLERKYQGKTNIFECQSSPREITIALNITRLLDPTNHHGQQFLNTHWECVPIKLANHIIQTGKRNIDPNSQ